MKIKVVWTIQGMDFEAVASTIAEAYEYIKAIVKAEKINFPDQEETLSQYMGILVGFQKDGTIEHHNHVFAIRKINGDNEGASEK